MNAKRDTRESLIEAGRKLFLTHGYHSTGVEALRGEVGAPKGVFYYHFPSKEALGLEVLGRYARESDERTRALLQDPARPPIERLRRYFEDMGEMFCGAGFAGGCMLGNFAQELADSSECFREALDGSFDRWQAVIADTLREARDRGEVPASMDPEATAGFLLNAWQGTILRAKVTKSRLPVDHFLDVTFRILLAA